MAAPTPSPKAVQPPAAPVSPYCRHAVTLSGDRHDLCLEVAYELDALARILPGLVPNVAEAKGAYFVVRGISGRLVRLAKVLLAAVDDEKEVTEELRNVITLEEPGQG